MSLIICRRPESDQWQYRFALGVSDIFGIGIAVLNRGDELIHIAANRDEFPVTIGQIHSAKANRDRYVCDGLRYEPLPKLKD
jgi:hypothetical protein